MVDTKITDVKTINTSDDTKNNTFTFKYDPTISLEGTFARMNETLKTKKACLQKDCTIANSIEAVYRSMSKSRLELFQCLVNKRPTSLYQLAQLLHPGTGVIELQEEKKKIRPIPLYERIVFDFSLLRDKRIIKKILQAGKNRYMNQTNLREIVIKDKSDRLMPLRLGKLPTNPNCHNEDCCEETLIHEFKKGNTLLELQ
ncbi:8324_t:CDS:2, partial [Funneliformis geosporum]